MEKIEQMTDDICEVIQESKTKGVIMPIHKTKSGGWKWGKSGKVYKTRAGAERQMKAIYASGWREKKD
jgi:hypothetical protein